MSKPTDPSRLDRYKNIDKQTPEARAFAKRLKDTLAARPDAPYGHGQIVWLHEQIVKRNGDAAPSKETLRRYVQGFGLPRESRPGKPNYGKMLADFLNVDYQWLVHGFEASKQERAREISASAAANVFAGLIMMDGGAPAFPQESDHAAVDDGVNLYAVIKGVQYRLNVGIAESKSDGFLVGVPAETLRSPTVLSLALVRRDPFCFDVLEMDADEMLARGKQKGSHIEVNLDADMRTGDHAWRRIQAFSQRL